MESACRVFDVLGLGIFGVLSDTKVRVGDFSVEFDVPFKVLGNSLSRDVGCVSY